MSTKAHQQFISLEWSHMSNWKIYSLFNGLFTLTKKGTKLGITFSFWGTSNAFLYVSVFMELILHHGNSWSFCAYSFNQFCNSFASFNNTISVKDRLSDFHGPFSIWRTLELTHWGRMTHICVGNLTIIGSDNGFSLGRHKAVIWTNAAILLIWPLGRKFSEILIETHMFSLNKMHLNV